MTLRIGMRVRVISYPPYLGPEDLKLGSYGTIDDVGELQEAPCWHVALDDGEGLFCFDEHLETAELSKQLRDLVIACFDRGASRVVWNGVAIDCGEANCPKQANLVMMYCRDEQLSARAWEIREVAP